MGRSSRYVLGCLAVALLPAAAAAQVYGFPGAAGVVDDGYGTLPPEMGAPLPPPVGRAPPPDLAGVAERPVPCALIIQIGKGLRHRAATHVVYGRADPCR